MSEPLQDVLVALFQVKGKLGFSRICDHVKRPPQQIEAALSVLRREGKARTMRPGEWELVPGPDPAADAIETSAIARSRSLVPPASTDQPVAGTRAFTPYSRLTPAPKPAANTDDQENTMSYKICEKCEGKKGPRAFNKGDPTCRECRGTNKAKPQGGVPTPKKKTNGAVKSIREIHAKHAKPNGVGRFTAALDFLKAERTKVSDELVKIDAAIETLQALG